MSEHLSRSGFRVECSFEQVTSFRSYDDVESYSSCSGRLEFT